MSLHVPQLAILPGGATYRMNPDHDIIIVEMTREKLVKLRRLNFCFPALFAIRPILIDIIFGKTQKYQFYLIL